MHQGSTGGGPGPGQVEFVDMSLDQALKLDAENPQALLLAGVAAMQAGNRAEALRHWEKLLPMLEPDSEIEAKLKRSIDKLKQGE